MQIPITVVVAAVLCAGSAVVVQTAPSDAPQQGPSASIPDMLKPQSPISGIETLSDTEGIDVGPYLGQWHRITETSLQSLISKQANPATPQSGTVVLRFKILPSGQLKDGSTVLERGSGQARLDKAVLDAIVGSAYPRLPEEFHGAYLELRVYWLYNSHLAK
jgi:TonB family protein